MLFALIVSSFYFVAPADGQVSGIVVNHRGQPVPRAAVHVEQGLSGPILSTSTDAGGRFTFDHVTPGRVGVFAVGDNLAFGGLSPYVPVDSPIDNLTVRLHTPASLTLKVVDEKNTPIANAEVTRILLQFPNGDDVGVPVRKVESRQAARLISGADGVIVLGNLPAEARIAAKIVHPQFAQATAHGLDAARRAATVTLESGVLLAGTIRTQNTDLPVANATVLVRSLPDDDAPPSTSIARSGSDGSFALRLVPGRYAYEATSQAYKSRNWREIVVDDRFPSQELILTVAPRGQVTGEVRDASTNDPIEGARLTLHSYGGPSSFGRTGKAGKFALDAPEGECVVRLETIPGYSLPPGAAVRVSVPGQATVEVPTFFAAPIPKYSLTVLDEEDAPVSGAVVSLLRPAQFGWRTTGGSGRVEIAVAALPEDGVVIGFAEHPVDALGAVFAIGPDQAGNAVVSLLPLATVRGSVIDDDGNPVRGAIIESRFSVQGVDDSSILWRTVTRPDGTYHWHGVPVYLPQLIRASDSLESGNNLAPPQSVIVESADAPFDGPVFHASRKPSGKTALGDSVRWWTNPPLCGPSPDALRSDAQRTVLLYGTGVRAEMLLDGLENVASILSGRPIALAAFIDEEFPCEQADIPVLAGTPPGIAHMYLLNDAGEVILESFGLPYMHFFTAPELVHTGGSRDEASAQK